MGQKVNLNLMGLGFLKSWLSAWFGTKEYSYLLTQDLKLRDFLTYLFYNLRSPTTEFKFKRFISNRIFITTIVYIPINRFFYFIKKNKNFIAESEKKQYMALASNNKIYTSKNKDKKKSIYTRLEKNFFFYLKYKINYFIYFKNYLKEKILYGLRISFFKYNKKILFFFRFIYKCAYNKFFYYRHRFNQIIFFFLGNLSLYYFNHNFFFLKKLIVKLFLIKEKSFFFISYTHINNYLLFREDCTLQATRNIFSLDIPFENKRTTSLLFGALLNFISTSGLQLSVQRNIPYFINLLTNSNSNQNNIKKITKLLNKKKIIRWSTVLNNLKNNNINNNCMKITQLQNSHTQPIKNFKTKTTTGLCINQKNIFNNISAIQFTKLHRQPQLKNPSCTYKLKSAERYSFFLKKQWLSSLLFSLLYKRIYNKKVTYLPIFYKTITAATTFLQKRFYFFIYLFKTLRKINNLSFFLFIPPTHHFFFYFLIFKIRYFLFFYRFIINSLRYFFAHASAQGVIMTTKTIPSLSTEIMQNIKIIPYYNSIQKIHTGHTSEILAKTINKVRINNRKLSVKQLPSLVLDKTIKTKFYKIKKENHNNKKKNSTRTANININTIQKSLINSIITNNSQIPFLQNWTPQRLNNLSYLSQLDGWVNLFRFLFLQITFFLKKTIPMPTLKICIDTQHNNHTNFSYFLPIGQSILKIRKNKRVLSKIKSIVSTKEIILSKKNGGELFFPIQLKKKRQIFIVFINLKKWWLLRNLVLNSIQLGISLSKNENRFIPRDGIKYSYIPNRHNINIIQLCNIITPSISDLQQSYSFNNLKSTNNIKITKSKNAIVTLQQKRPILGFLKRFIESLIFLKKIRKIATILFQKNLIILSYSQFLYKSEITQKKIKQNSVISSKIIKKIKKLINSLNHTKRNVLNSAQIDFELKNLLAKIITIIQKQNTYTHLFNSEKVKYYKVNKDMLNVYLEKKNRRFFNPILNKTFNKIKKLLWYAFTTNSYNSNNLLYNYNLLQELFIHDTLRFNYLNSLFLGFSDEITGNLLIKKLPIINNKQIITNNKNNLIYKKPIDGYNAYNSTPLTKNKSIQLYQIANYYCSVDAKKFFIFIQNKIKNKQLGLLLIKFYYYYYLTPTVLPQQNKKKKKTILLPALDSTHRSYKRKTNNTNGWSQIIDGIYNKKTMHSCNCSFFWIFNQNKKKFRGKNFIKEFLYCPRTINVESRLLRGAKILWDSTFINYLYKKNKTNPNLIPNFNCLKLIILFSFLSTPIETIFRPNITFVKKLLNQHTDIIKTKNLQSVTKIAWTCRLLTTNRPDLVEVPQIKNQLSFFQPMQLQYYMQSHPVNYRLIAYNSRGVKNAQTATVYKYKQRRLNYSKFIYLSNLWSNLSLFLNIIYWNRTQKTVAEMKKKNKKFIHSFYKLFKLSFFSLNIFFLDKGARPPLQLTQYRPEFQISSSRRDAQTNPRDYISTIFISKQWLNVRDQKINNKNKIITINPVFDTIEKPQLDLFIMPLGYFNATKTTFFIRFFNLNRFILYAINNLSKKQTTLLCKKSSITFITPTTSLNESNISVRISHNMSNQPLVKLIYYYLQIFEKYYNLLHTDNKKRYINNNSNIYYIYTYYILQPIYYYLHSYAILLDKTIFIFNHIPNSIIQTTTLAFEQKHMGIKLNVHAYYYFIKFHFFLFSFKNLLRRAIAHRYKKIKTYLDSTSEIEKIRKLQRSQNKNETIHIDEKLKTTAVALPKYFAHSIKFLKITLPIQLYQKLYTHNTAEHIYLLLLTYLLDLTIKMAISPSFLLFKLPKYRKILPLPLFRKVTNHYTQPIYVQATTKSATHNNHHLDKYHYLNSFNICVPVLIKKKFPSNTLNNKKYNSLETTSNFHKKKIQHIIKYVNYIRNNKLDNYNFLNSLPIVRTKKTNIPERIKKKTEIHKDKKWLAILPFTDFLLLNYNRLFDSHFSTLRSNIYPNIYNKHGDYAKPIIALADSWILSKNKSKEWLVYRNNIKNLLHIYHTKKYLRFIPLPHTSYRYFSECATLFYTDQIWLTTFTAFLLLLFIQPLHKLKIHQLSNKIKRKKKCFNNAYINYVNSNIIKTDKCKPKPTINLNKIVIINKTILPTIGKMRARTTNYVAQSIKFTIDSLGRSINNKNFLFFLVTPTHFIFYPEHNNLLTVAQKREYNSLLFFRYQPQRIQLKNSTLRGYKYNRFTIMVIRKLLIVNLFVSKQFYLLYKELQKATSFDFSAKTINFTSNWPGITSKTIVSARSKALTRLFLVPSNIELNKINLIINQPIIHHLVVFSTLKRTSINKKQFSATSIVPIKQKILKNLITNITKKEMDPLIWKMHKMSGLTWWRSHLLNKIIINTVPFRDALYLLRALRKEESISYVILKEFNYKIEYSIYKYTKSKIIFLPIYYFYCLPPLKSASMLGQYIVFELEKGLPYFLIIRFVKTWYFNTIQFQRELIKTNNPRLRQQVISRIHLLREVWAESLIGKEKLFNKLVPHSFLEENQATIIPYGTARDTSDRLYQINNLFYNYKYLYLNGLRIACSGRFNRRNTRAETIWFSKGVTGTQTLWATLDYATFQAITRLGTLGIQVWLSLIDTISIIAPTAIYNDNINDEK